MSDNITDFKPGDRVVWIGSDRRLWDKDDRLCNNPTGVVTDYAKAFEMGVVPVQWDQFTWGESVNPKALFNLAKAST